MTDKPDMEATYHAALLKLRAVLGPTVPKCCDCQGCSTEWGIALEVLEDVLDDNSTDV